MLSSLHYLFPPDSVEAFVRADLRQARKVQGMGSGLDEKGNGYSGMDLRRDLIGVLNGMTIEPLSQRQLRYLYQVIREKTPRQFRDA
jgi:hypothetical protein